MSIDRKKIFSDETENFASPAEPVKGDRVRLRLRAARGDRLEAYLVHNGERVRMEIAESDDFFDYYEAVTPELTETYSYHYEIWDEQGICSYNRLGLVGYVEEAYDFKLIPDFSVPPWAKGAVMYQIFTDRFCNGDPANDVQDREYLYINGMASKHRDWFDLPEAMDVQNFYGGDLQGVWDKLDYLQTLGVEVLYFNPLFVSPSNHKYDIQDYDHIDPHFGVIAEDGGELLPDGARNNQGATRYIRRTTAKVNLEASDAFFARFVAEVHRRGMKVILDGVFNHCGSFHKWMDREGFYQGQEDYAPGAFGHPESPYRDYFSFSGDGKYESWWNHDTLPKLNYEKSEELCQEILRIGVKWVSPPYTADGWRLDVAADLGHSPEFNHHFWRRFRKAVKKANPNAVILAEHYGDVTPWLEGDQWDTVMNYDAFMEPVTYFLTGMEKHSDAYEASRHGNGQAFFETMRYHMSRFSYSSLHSAMNQLDNHDHSRFLTRTNGQVGRVATVGPGMAGYHVNYGIYREALVIQMTWPGAPTLYYGDEVGMIGWTDPDNRRTFPWGREDWELYEFNRYMIRLHKFHPCLRRGSLCQLRADYQVIAYGRFLGTDKVVVAVNNSSEPQQLRLQVDLMGIPDGELVRCMESMEDGYNVGALPIPVKDGWLSLDMKPVSAVVLTTRPHGGARKL